jgi:hypothetical protein
MTWKDILTGDEASLMQVLYPVPHPNPGTIHLNQNDHC